MYITSPGSFFKSFEVCRMYVSFAYPNLSCKSLALILLPISIPIAAESFFMIFGSSAHKCESFVFIIVSNFNVTSPFVKINISPLDSSLAPFLIAVEIIFSNL
ncbi:hypothetical protein IV203_025076 [Nitzschia inconspicua]|uniref:Uncharacterized protein n=1 Tax=Nitzschia inconspicua TaxID=303405 RepID=A0A9K3Q074_9STRA|nr:hypothetical protein IV203_025076 [Nitzschia inconspicua]